MANQEFFVDRTLSITDIDGNGLVPNTVDVITSVPHGLKVGDTITIAGVVTQTDYNLDIGVTVVTIISPTNFLYETTNHTEADLDTTGSVRVLDPYSFDDTVDNLGQFVHLNAGLSGSTNIEIAKDGINYVLLANGDSLIGDIFRSEILKNGQKLNVRPVTGIDIQYGTLYREP